MPSKAICKGCGKEIYWIKMASGKMMPINTTFASVVRVDQQTKIGEIMTIQSGYLPHWVTCPRAKDFKK